MTAEERERLIEAVLARYREVLQQRLRDAPQTLDEIEQAVEDISQAMDDELERRLLERQEQPAVPEDNRAACPHCGRVRGVVYDGASHRCYGCFRSFTPAPASEVRA